MYGDDARFFDVTSAVLALTHGIMEMVMPKCDVLSDFTELPRSSTGNVKPLGAQIAVEAIPYFLPIGYICVAYQRILSSISANQAALDVVASYIGDKFSQLSRVHAPVSCLFQVACSRTDFLSNGDAYLFESPRICGSFYSLHLTVFSNQELSGEPVRSPQIQAPHLANWEATGSDMQYSHVEDHLSQCLYLLQH
jgi:hypothetical protein